MNPENPLVHGEKRIRCSDFCVENCDDLNGDVHYDCGGCDTGKQCNPTAPNFPKGHVEPPEYPDNKHGSPPDNDTKVDGWQESDTQDDEQDGHDGDEHHKDADEHDEGESQEAPVWGEAVEGRAKEATEKDLQEMAASAASWRNRTGMPCDFERIHWTGVTREMLEARKTPLIILGVTDGWKAMTEWQHDNMLAKHGDKFFQLNTNGSNVTMRQVLEDNKDTSYHMGHVKLGPHECYAKDEVPYSPFITHEEHVAHDYSVPRFLTPCGTLQMGIGAGRGVGVPPEHHPSSWFAAVVGRKRWILHPNAGEPPPLMRVEGGESPGGEQGQGAAPHLQNGKVCELTGKLKKGGLICDQQEGEVIWTPGYWWHETCGLDAYSVGIGGVTYRGIEDAEPEVCDAEVKKSMKQNGDDTSDEGFRSEPYAVRDIRYCQEQWSRCPMMSGLRIHEGNPAETQPAATAKPA